MENEENRGLINKKASEDQWARLGQSNFRSLSLFSLSHTLGYLDFSWGTLGCGILGFLDQEVKGRAGKHKRTSRSTITLDFPAGTELHV